MVLEIDLAQPENSYVDRVRRDLGKDGYRLLNDSELGFDASFRAHMANRYFRPEVMDAHDDLDRSRVRDVLRYTRTGDGVRLREHDTVDVRARPETRGERRRRLELLEDQEMSRWIATVLSLVPLGDRDDAGTCSVNVVRARSDVVQGKHQDGERFVVIHVLDRCGGGAKTSLVKARAPDDTVFSATLYPGDMVIFRDRLFLHTTTPLTPPLRGSGFRDAVLCTVNYPEESIVSAH